MDVMAEGSGESQPYTLIKLTPAHLKVLNQTIAPGERRIPTRTLMIGGEALDAGRCCCRGSERFPDVRVVNHLRSNGRNSGMLHSLEYQCL